MYENSRRYGLSLKYGMALNSVKILPMQKPIATRILIFQLSAFFCLFPVHPQLPHPFLQRTHLLFPQRPCLPQKHLSQPIHLHQLQLLNLRSRVHNMRLTCKWIIQGIQRRSMRRSPIPTGQVKRFRVWCWLSNQRAVAVSASTPSLWMDSLSPITSSMCRNPRRIFGIIWKFRFHSHFNPAAR